ncbi:MULTISPECIES: AAA family ATPase [Gluconobacter]|uniref:AAA family ATPase n=1 Tax=Gluconobacter cadivus TaxID=2728101 RepID=A0ABR9YUY3_9PROT|nr:MULTISPECIES: AAA family ATPase [Gluconobacter]MBF0888344.1 AAA family ATPase [Gluconobacter cadivus]MBS1060849.1 AAA family ATPase [Gluconobacter sp. Dm-44]
MITAIEIAGEATYPAAGERLTDLKKVNYLFGHNGCGKTTISRAVNDAASRAGFKVIWANGRTLETLVYNRDFAEHNFGEQMPGIFTLGEESTQAAADIARLSQEIEAIDRQLAGLRVQLQGDDGNSGRQGELAAARTALEHACWKSQQDHKDKFEAAFTGHRGGRVAFCDKVLQEAAVEGVDLKTLEELIAHAETVFQSAAPVETSIPAISFDRLTGLDGAAILARQVVGRDDVVVAELIRRLGNSDWVKQGVGYLDVASGRCPFCQQPTPPDLTRDLNEFFDEQYLRDVEAIAGLKRDYTAAVDTICARIDAMLSAPSRFIDASVLEEHYTALKTVLALNQSRIDAKQREPSNVVNLEPTSTQSAAISAMITAANEAAEGYNKTIRDLGNAKRRLIAEVWRFVVEERRTDLDTFTTATSGIQRTITGLQASITNKAALRTEKDRERRQIEESITSVRPTVDTINSILASFGFLNFKLEVAGERSDMYRIVRLDGTDAARTLSEGERSFITFLYFYHRLAGSLSSNNTTAERIVVFDDPVSSLDADVLFIVSALIRRVISDTSDDRGNIKQVFVLTHNIYFHKEVSYDRRRPLTGVRAFETFWVVRKRDNVSSLHRYEQNPVKTSYELLWEDVRNPNRASLTIQNTMRRIVENYLIVLGGLKQDEIVAKFDGRDSQICASLFSWINDGSHSAHDDIYVAIDENAVEGYLRVFEQVFEKTGQGAHYRMMMRVDDVNDDEAPAEHATAAALMEQPAR